MNIADRIGYMLSTRRDPASSVKLTQHNVYIFPSKVGFMYLLLLILMLLTAINYQNSLIYLFVFFLGSLFIISIWMCFLNFARIKILAGRSTHSFAYENTAYEVSLTKEGADANSVLLAREDFKTHFTEIPHSETVLCTVLDKPKSRGVYQIDRVYLHSYYPFGLIRAWSWPRLNALTYVFPKPIDSGGKKRGAPNASNQDNIKESEEFNDIKPYQEGQPVNRIVWKRYAAKDELVVRDHEKSSVSHDWVRWDDYEEGNVELSLSYMCHDILALSANRQRYGIELPGKIIAPSKGEQHQIECLKALAEFPA